jgi:hypothetical protein
MSTSTSLPLACRADPRYSPSHLSRHDGVSLAWRNRAITMSVTTVRGKRCVVRSFDRSLGRGRDATPRRATCHRVRSTAFLSSLSSFDVSGVISS